MSSRDLLVKTSAADYVVELRVKNGRLLKRIRAAGYKTVAEFSRAAGISSAQVGVLLNLKISGMHSRDEWRLTVQKIATFLRCLPEDIIPPQHIKSALSKNTAEIEMSPDDVVGIMSDAGGYLADTNLKRDEARRLIDEALQKLTPREERVLRLRFGLTDDGEEKNLETVAAQFAVTTERIRQIEMRAIRRLRHRSRHGRKLSSILSDGDLS